MGKLAPKQVQPSTKETTPESKQKGFLGFLNRKLVRAYIWVLNSVWGGYAFLIGSHDLLSPRAAERNIGVLFFIGGMALTVSAIWVLMSQNGIGQANGKKMNYALVGVILGLLPGLTLIFIQLDYYGYSRRVGFWLLAVVIPALGAWILWNKGARLVFFRGPGSVTILAACIALLPPLIGGTLRPVENATLVDAQMNMHVVGHRVDPKLGNVAVIECKLTIKNIAKRRLIVVGSLYSVRATDSRQRKSPKKADWHMASELRDQYWSGRYESPWNNTTVDEVGYDMFSPGDTLEPGQQVVITLLPVVPYDQYDTVDAYASVATAFDDRLKLGAQRTRVENQTLNQRTPVKAIWDIEQTSLAVWLTQGPQNLTVTYGMDRWQNKFSGLYLELGTGRYLQKQQTSGQYNPRVVTAYGLGFTIVGDSVILDATSP